MSILSPELWRPAATALEALAAHVANADKSNFICPIPLNELREYFNDDEAVRLASFVWQLDGRIEPSCSSELIDAISDERQRGRHYRGAWKSASYMEENDESFSQFISGFESSVERCTARIREHPRVKIVSVQARRRDGDSRQERSFFFLSLPKELQLEIIDNLRTEDISRLHRASKSFGYLQKRLYTTVDLSPCGKKTPRHVLALLCHKAAAPLVQTLKISTNHTMCQVDKTDMAKLICKLPSLETLRFLPNVRYSPTGGFRVETFDASFNFSSTNLVTLQIPSHFLLVGPLAERLPPRLECLHVDEVKGSRGIGWETWVQLLIDYIKGKSSVAQLKSLRINTLISLRGDAREELNCICRGKEVEVFFGSVETHEWDSDSEEE